MTYSEANYLIGDVKSLNSVSNSQSTLLSPTFNISIDEEGIWMDENNTRDFKIADYLVENWFKGTRESQKYGDLAKVIIKSVLDNWPSREKIVDDGFNEVAKRVSSIAVGEARKRVEEANSILGLG